MNSAGGNEAAARVLPAHQRLDADSRPLASSDDRLVVEHELLALDGALQVREQLEPLEHRCLHARFEDLVAALAVRLGDVHRDVGVAQQSVGVVRTRRGRSIAIPMLAPHEQLLAVEREWRRAAPRRCARRPSIASSASATSSSRMRELVAAEAGDGVGRAQARLHALGHLGQQPVAGGVAEAVVDALEVVEVEEQHGDAAAGAAPRARARARARSVKRVRLARLVSGSCSAWWRSCCSRLLRSVTSRMFSTRPPIAVFSRWSVPVNSR